MSATYDVVICAKDMAEFIEATLDSVLASDVPPGKIIIVDDGSSDGTADKAAKKPKTMVIRNGVNKGKSYSRNLGISQSTTDYIQFIDADDLLHPKKTAIQLDYFAKNPGTGMVWGDVKLFQDGKDPDAGDLRSYETYDDLLEQLIVRNHIALHSLMARRDYFDRFGWFDEYFRISQDRELYIRSILNGAKWAYTPGALCYYRRHPGSTIASKLTEAAHYNAMAVRIHRKKLAEFEGGRLCQKLVDSLRTLARNANIHGRPPEEVRSIIEEAYALGMPNMPQNALYAFVEHYLGATFLEQIIRPKYDIERKLGWHR